MKLILFVIITFCLLIEFGCSNSVGSNLHDLSFRSGIENSDVKVIDSGSSDTLSNSNIQFDTTNSKDASLQEQYRASYYYTGQRPQFVNGEWNRDTYANAATDLGYNADSSQNYGSYHPVPSTSYGTHDDDGYDFDGGAAGGLGGLGGLAGLLGIKGLKGLGILGLLKLGILPLLFLVIPALLILPILLLFIPIPVITVPQGRSFGVDIKDIGGRMSTLARSVLDSDKCIERMSCEMSRYSRGTFIDKTLKRVIYKYETQMSNPLQRMARAYLEPMGCKKYNCFLLDDVVTSTKKYKKTS